MYVEKTATLAMQLNFATQAIYMWAIGLVKISIGLFLLRFAPRRSYKILIWAIIGVYHACLPTTAEVHVYTDKVNLVSIALMALYTTICFFVRTYLPTALLSNALTPSSPSIDPYIPMQRYSLDMGYVREIKMLFGHPTP